MKYKVGDRVKVRKDLKIGERYFMLDGKTHNSFVFDMEKYRGKVVTIARERGRQYSIKEDDGVWGWVDGMFGGLAPSKIVVTTDGQTTTARLFSGKELVKSAEAKCSPQDAFVFETGAAIALDRLLDREEKAELVKPVNPFKVGDYVRVTSQTRLGHHLPIGSVGRVTRIATCDSCLVDGFFVNGDRIDQYVPTCDLIKV